MIRVQPATKQRLARYGANKLFGNDIDERKEMSADELEARFEDVWQSTLHQLATSAEACTSEEVPGRLTENQRKFFNPQQEHRSFRYGGAEFIVQLESDGELWLNQLWRVSSSDTHPKTLSVNFRTVEERERFAELAKRLNWDDEDLGLRLIRNFMQIHEGPGFDEEKEALASWESDHLGTGEKGTSDWPGWKKYIGPPPWEYETN